MRLQKFLSQQGVCSRREAEGMISARKILINGTVATLGDQVEGNELILISGKKLIVRDPEKIVLAWNKPIGVEVTFDNSHGGKTLKSFDFGPERVVPIGRLDKDSHGLLLLTNDGDLCNFLAHPRYEHSKEYIVTVEKSLFPVEIEKLGNGTIHLNNKSVKSCIVEQITPKQFKIILEEGRNRQIRKMCEACRLIVKDLFRVRVKSIEIGDLKSGEWKKLSENEVERLRQK
jgi:23S rRNA pseudouridine2604 synthase